MKNLVRFLGFYRPACGWVLLGLFLSVVVLAANLALIGISGWFLAAMGIAGAAGISMNYFTPAAIIRGLAILRTGGRYAERLVTHDAALRVTSRLRTKLYDKLRTLPVTALPGHSADALSVLRGDTDTLERFFLAGFVPLCTALIGLVAFGAVLWHFIPLLAVYQMVFLVAGGVAFPLLLQWRTERLHASLAQTLPALRMQYADYVQGMDEWLVYGADEAMAGAIDRLQQDIAGIQRGLNKHEGLGASVFMLMTLGALLATFLVSVPLVQAGHVSAAAFAMLPLLAMVSFDIVLPVPAALQALAAARHAAARLFALLDRPCEHAGAQIPADTFRLSLRNVSFNYPSGPPVLRDVSFDLDGESVAILGPNGIGKSTLASIMSGLIEPSSGTVTLNGLSSADARPDSWQALFSVAEQRPFLFSGSIRDNLLRAAPHADTHQLHDACALAGITDEIARMPHGLDTDIGEEGEKLSGGQRRRLSIARAWLKQAPCLILDEPGEGLDETMALDLIRRILAAAKAGEKTVVIITHDAKIAALFDQKIELKITRDPDL